MNRVAPPPMSGDEGRLAKYSVRTDGEMMRRFSAKSRINSQSAAGKISALKQDERELLRRVNQCSAAPAGEPFPTGLDEIRGSVIPTSVSHPFRARLSFDRCRRILFHSSSAWFLRLSPRILPSHISSFLAWARSPLGGFEARPGSAGR